MSLPEFKTAAVETLSVEFVTDVLETVTVVVGSLSAVLLIKIISNLQN